MIKPETNTPKNFWNPVKTGRAGLIFLCLTFLCVAFSAGFTPLSVAQENAPGQVPRADFNTRRHDFGTIYRGQVIPMSFPFTNTGNGTLIFGSVHSPCGCLNTDIFDSDHQPERVFLPNERGTVQVSFDSQSFRGPVLKTLTLETNMGSSSPSISLNLSANVKEELRATPDLLYTGRLKSTEVKSFNIAVSFLGAAKSNGKIRILSLKTTHPAVTAELMGQNDTEAKINLTVSAGKLPLGSINTLLVIENNSTYLKKLEVPIVGEVLGHIETSNNYVEFGVVREERSSEQTITIESLSPSFRITGVKTNLKNLDALEGLKSTDLFHIKTDKQPTRDGKTLYRLTFTLKHPKKILKLEEQGLGVNISGSFVIHTNDADYKEILIPFFGMLRTSAQKL